MQIHIKKIFKSVKSNIKLCIKSLNIMFVLIHDIFLRNYIKKIFLGILKHPINRLIFIVYCSNLNNKARYTATFVQVDRGSDKKG